MSEYTVICTMPKKVKWYRKLYRIPIIILHGKYSLIGRIHKRDIEIFRKAWNEFSQDTIRTLNRKYGADSYNLFLDFLNGTITDKPYTDER